MPSSPTALPAPGSVIITHLGARQARATKPAGPRPPIVAPGGVQPDGVNDFLNSLHEEYEKTSSPLRPESDSTHSQ